MIIPSSCDVGMKIHYLSPEFIHAERVSPSKLASKLKAGWHLRRLVPGFSSMGMANYSRAVVSPHGVIAMVSDRAEAAEELDSLPALEISYEVVLLAVPFEEKEEAKRLGAVWAQGIKTWACAPDRIEAFQHWLGGEPELFDMLNNTYVRNKSDDKGAAND